MPTTDILIYGQVTPEMATEVKAQLAELDSRDAIVVRIDSPGGSVFAGLSIFEAIRKYKGPKRAVIESAAFSIASYIAMAFDDIEIAPNGYMMVHNPSVAVQGDDAELDRKSKMVGQLKKSMLEMYSKRTGLDEDEIQELLTAETFLDAKECVERGFATRVSAELVASRIEETDQLPAAVFASIVGAKVGGNDHQPREAEMANPTPQAASVTEIRAAYPKMSDSFVIACLEKGMPMASVSEAVVQEQAKTIDSLTARVAEMEAAEAARLETEAVQKTEAEAKAKADAEAKAKAAGQPAHKVGNSEGGPDATARWSEALADCRKKYSDPAKAVQACNRANPGLREAMLAEVNAR